MSLNGNVELALLEPVLEGYRGADRSKLLPVLHDVQRIYGYLPEPALEAVSRTLRVPLADIHGVVEFYSLFYGEPVGRRIIRICTDPSCMVNGAEDSLAAACKHAGGIQPGETSADGRVTVERSPCLGLCDQAPAALVDDMAVVGVTRSEEHTSELQSRPHLVCRLLLEKKNKQLATVSRVHCMQ